MIFSASDYLLQGTTAQSDPAAIARAVAACAAAGGGTVEITSGVWNSLPLELFSGVHLQLQRGAVVEFTADRQAYFPPVFVRWEGVECFSARPLIYAKDACDVAITGNGTLRGNGAAWHAFGAKPEHRRRADSLRKMSDLAVNERILDHEDNFLRPSFIHFVNCHNVRWENFTIEDAPMWTLHPVYCRQVVARGLTIRTQGPNTDGLDPDSCEDVLVENCTFSTGDDCIALKSGLNADGWRIAKPCRKIRIRDCRMLAGHAGVALGSELSGGIENVEIENCEMSGVGLGIRIKSLPGRGGFVRNVQVRNIVMDRIRSSAIHLDMAYPQTTLPATAPAGTELMNISFDNIICRDTPIGIFLRGDNAMPVKEVTFSRLDIDAQCAIQREGGAFPCRFTACDPAFAGL